MDSVSVVMPAFNLGKEIKQNLSVACKAFDERKLDYEIIVVDDGSQDETLVEAKKFAAKNRRVKVLSLEQNKGKGEALKHGTAFASKQVIAFIDADLDLPPEQISVFLDYLEHRKVDLVIGSKRHRLSKINYPPLRRFLSFGYSILIKILFNLNVSDTQVGFKVMRAELAKRIIPLVRVERYAFDLELLAIAKRFGYKIAEAPIVLNYSGFGSGVGLKAIWEIFQDTLKVFWRINFSGEFKP